MDVENSPSHSLIGALEQDLMSSQEGECGSHHSDEKAGHPVRVQGPRTSRRLVLVCGCQDTTVVPSDDGPHVQEVVVFADGLSQGAEDSAPTVRVSVGEVELKDVAKELRGWPLVTKKRRTQTVEAK